MGSPGGGPRPRLGVGPRQLLRARSDYLPDGDGHADPPHWARRRGPESVYAPSGGGGDDDVGPRRSRAAPRDTRPGERAAPAAIADGDPLRRYRRARLGIDRPDTSSLDRSAVEAQRQSSPAPTDVPAATSDPDLYRGLPDAVPRPMRRESRRLPRAPRRVAAGIPEDAGPRARERNRARTV